MKTTILTTRDVATWNDYLVRLPGADIYHTPEYHRAHEANGDGTALCFVAEEGDNLLVHPFMQRPIPGTEWCDIESVYGYSGPLAGSNPRFMGSLDALFMADAWAEFRHWCSHQNVVAEFVRFNPLNGYQQYVLRDPNVTFLDRYTVVLDLSGTPDDLLARGEKRHRGRVRRASKEGLWASEGCGDAYTVFESLYQRTMEHNHAADYYSFGQFYFYGLESGLGDRLKLLVVRDAPHGDRIVASGLFLLYRDRMHYHLAGSDPDYPGYGDNNLLLHTAALWGQEHGYRWLHLGGGRTAAPDDSLLRFKASVSRERRPFYTGRRIHNQEAYDRLCADWMRQHGVTERPDYFLLWRKPCSDASLG